MKEIIARPGEIVIEMENSIITSYALGCSLGICLYDSKKKVGGFVNSLLPTYCAVDDELKYVDTAIMILYQEMLKHGSHHDDLNAKIIGGALLFDLLVNDEEDDIGKCNTISAYTTLATLNIPIVGEDVGDTYGRTVHFHINNGVVYIETGNKHVYHV
ncbi:chemotaxis protein CheD [Thomasclavelia sp.]